MTRPVTVREYLDLLEMTKGQQIRWYIDNINPDAIDLTMDEFREAFNAWVNEIDPKAPD